MALKIYACILSLLCVYLSGKRLLDKEYRDCRVFLFCVTLLFFVQSIIVLFALLSS
jgi:hypothetical protein